MLTLLPFHMSGLLSLSKYRETNKYWKTFLLKNAGRASPLPHLAITGIPAIKEEISTTTGQRGGMISHDDRDLLLLAYL